MRGRRLTQSKKLSKLAVATDSTTSSRLTPGSARVARVVVIAACLVLALAGGFLLTKSKSTTDTPEQNGTAVATLVAQAKDKLAAENPSELEALVNDIVATNDYETNQDALYVVVTYYIRTSNAVKAREYLDRLMLMYDGSKGFSKDLGTTKTILQLEADVKFLEKQANPYKDGLSAGVSEE